MKTLKQKFTIFILAAALLASGVWGYFYFRNRDERLLRALVSELEDMAAKRPGKSNALALLDAATPERVFADKVKVDSDTPKIHNVFTLKDLSRTFVAMKKNCSSASLDMNISEIIIDQDKATVSGEAIFSGSSSGRGGFREIRQVTLECIKDEGKWRIASVTSAALLKR